MPKILTYRSPGLFEGPRALTECLRTDVPQSAQPALTEMAILPGSQAADRQPARAAVRFSGGAPPPAETDTEVTIVPEEDIDESLDQPWHVIIYDDPVNLMNYVTMVIQRIFSYPSSTAERMMLEVHTQGKSVVWTGGSERAEHYVHQLQSYQLQAAMKKAG